MSTGSRTTSGVAQTSALQPVHSVPGKNLPPAARTSAAFLEVLVRPPPVLNCLSAAGAVQALTSPVQYSWRAEGPFV